MTDKQNFAIRKFESCFGDFKLLEKKKDIFMDDSSLKDKFSFHCIVKYFLFASNAILWVSNFTNANKLAKIVSNHFHTYQQLKTAVYKSGTGTRGRGHWDACVGTWDLGTRAEGRGDIWYGTRDVWDAGTRGRVGRGRGDVECRGRGR